MKSTWTLKENSTGTLKVEVEKEVWQKAQAKVLEEKAKNIEVKGFRKGHAPLDVVRKQIDQQQLLFDAINEVANDAFVYGILEEKVEPVAQPQMTIDAMTEEELILSFIVTVKPEVELGEYKGIEVEEMNTEVTEEELNEALNNLRRTRRTCCERRNY